MIAASKVASIIVVFSALVAIGSLGFGVLQASREGLETISRHVVTTGVAASAVSIVVFFFAFMTGMPLDFNLGL